MSMPRRYQQHCRLLRIATLMVFAGLLVLLSLGMVGHPWWRGTAATQDGSTWVLLAVLRFLPGLGYLWALWAVQRALADLGSSRMFQATVARAMRHVGLGVLAGALLNVFAVTNLWRWMMGGQGGYLYFDLSAIVLGVVGAALVLLAEVVDKARALQDELEEFL